MDKRVLHLDITSPELNEWLTVEAEYHAIARLIREASALGTELVIFDTIYVRGIPETAEPILKSTIPAPIGNGP